MSACGLVMSHLFYQLDGKTTMGKKKIWESPSGRNNETNALTKHLDTLMLRNVFRRLLRHFT